MRIVIKDKPLRIFSFLNIFISLTALAVLFNVYFIDQKEAFESLSGILLYIMLGGIVHIISTITILYNIIGKIKNASKEDGDNLALGIAIFNPIILWLISFLLANGV